MATTDFVIFFLCLYFIIRGFMRGFLKSLIIPISIIIATLISIIYFENFNSDDELEGWSFKNTSHCTGNGN